MTKDSSDKRARNWRAISQLPAKFQILQVKVVESNILATQEITLDRINAIVGAHGSGKTLFLRALETAFGHGSNFGSTPPFFEHGRYAEIEILGIFEITIKWCGKEITRRINLASDGNEREKIWKDAIGTSAAPRAGTVPDMLTRLSMVFQSYDTGFRNRDFKWRSPVPEYHYRRAELAAIKNILGKEYAEVSAYGIPDGTEEPHNKIFDPYFVARGGSTIDSAQMSLGESWVHYLIGWDRLQCAAYSLAELAEPRLIDEPETFLAMPGHRPLIDELVRCSLELNSQLIVATHSPKVLSSFPLNHVRVCVPSPSGIMVVEPSSYAQVKDSLGIDFFVKAIILVEDKFAATVLQCLCAELDPSLPREVDIVSTGGEAEVVAGARIMRRSQRMHCIGVLDGDFRNDRAKTKGLSNIYFLPGSMSPEQELAAIATKSIERFAHSIDRSTADIYAALSICSSLDHQYWFPRMASTLGRSEAVIVQTLIRLWLEFSDTADQAEELIAAIREIME
ncbi:hypothetical protein K7711_36450 [Nocardia sp. CA2R105]|uniref:ATP-dependent nuclease n=1 Tax=Nocardia coffeae TaxID=2873381 RepID=UPI001CA6F2D2|nr:hypothetical protein [Nocardia coffeae]MBY8862015.1 hypothetical protein [Nocardia coffeae]